MSKKAVQKFLSDIEVLIRQDRRIDPTRDFLDRQTQGYAVGSVAIYEDIKKPESPFRHMNPNITDSELNVLAEKISEDWYSILEKIVKSKATARVSVNKINTNEELANLNGLGYNKSKRIIYVSMDNSYRYLSEKIIFPAKQVVKSRPINDPVRIYVLPDIEWINAVEEARKAVFAATVTQFQKEYPKDIKLITNNEELKDQKVIRLEGPLSPTNPAVILNSTLTKKFKKSVENRLKKATTELKKTKYAYLGVDVGHAFGSIAYAAAQLLENPHDIVHSDFNKLELVSDVKKELPPELSLNIKNSIIAILNVDIAVDIEKEYGTNHATTNARITVTSPENSILNRSSGGRAGKEAQQAETGLVHLLKQASERLYSLESSISHKEFQEQWVLDRFFERKTKPYKNIVKAKKKVTSKKTVVIRKLKLGNKVRSTNKNVPIVSGVTQKTNLDSIIPMLNRKFHDAIKAQMGKGTAKKKLNYRTGRFAKSAIIESITPSKTGKTAEAKVKYMKNPYAVFSPEGHLYRPLRDPAGIFGRSIRQMLIEEKIAEYARVKVNTYG